MQILSSAGGCPYICNDRVTVVCRDKVLDLARRGGVEMVPADKVRSEVVFGGSGARVAISRPVGSVVCNSSGHVVCRNSHAPEKRLAIGREEEDEEEAAEE